ncbi:MAG: DUF86 domain-containing protein [Chloroflexi bacterium]|nr:DUF86 domain-containing protein [Chloroflexota bacterium]
MNRDVLLYLDDILEAIRKIDKYADASSLDEFSNNGMAIDAIVRNFEVMGEATKHIPESIRRKYPAVPWKIMAGMRDVLIHQYFGVDIPALWKTIKEDLPGVEPQIEALLKDLDNRDRA